MKMITEDDVDDCLQQLYDWVDSDEYVMQMLLQYVHEHREEVAAWISTRMNDTQ